MESKITVIVPVFNVEPYLEKCLTSIVNQTYSNLEIICVNDGSTDASATILAAFSASDPRIRVISQHNAGVSCARNAALDQATGEFLLFVDGDDWIDLSTCEIALDEMRKSTADVVMWSYVREYPETSRPKQIMSSDRSYDEHEVKQLLHRRMVGPIKEELSRPENADALCTIWGKLYRRNLIEDKHIRFYDIREIGTYEDGLFNLEVFSYAKKVIFVNQNLYHYRKNNPSSITTSFSPNLQYKYFTLFSILRKHATSSTYVEALSNRIALSLIPLGINEMSRTDGVKEKLHGIKTIISTAHFTQAIKSFHMRFLPLHWRFFFLCARYKCSMAVYLLLAIIQIIRGSI